MSDASRIIRLRNGYHVWTRRIEARPQPPERPTPPGTSPAWCPRVLLLHGGPGFSHEYLENFEQHLPPAGVELYFYDQLGSYFSDQPDDPSLWTVDRFAQEVEAVREALGLEDFFLVGQSWGGMLAMEYVLRYQPDGAEGPVRGLVISNMTASIASYVRSVQRLRQQLPAETLAILERYEQAGAFDAPEYQSILTEELYKKHLCRLDPWPEPVRRAFAHANLQVYNTMQGPNEFVVTGNFKDWDRWDDLHRIGVPTLLLVGRHDTMAVEDIEEMGRRIPDARVVVCPEGSHLSHWDDEAHYFDALLAFIRAIAARRQGAREH